MQGPPGGIRSRRAGVAVVGGALLLLGAVAALFAHSRPAPSGPPAPVPGPGPTGPVAAPPLPPCAAAPVPGGGARPVAKIPGALAPAVPSRLLPVFEGDRPAYLRVRVVRAGEGGRPVPGARVDLVYAGEFQGFVPRRESATTGIDGTAAFELRPGVEPWLVARVEGLVPAYAQVKGLVAGEEQEAGLALEAGVRFEGTVVGDASDAPVVGARVRAQCAAEASGGWLQSEVRPSLGGTTTDGAGRFSFPCLPSTGFVSFRVDAAGYESRTCCAIRLDSGGRVVPDGGEEDTNPYRIRLALGSVLRGHVTRSDGTPAAGAVVWALRGVYQGDPDPYAAEGNDEEAGGLAWDMGLNATVRADGSYELAGLGEGGEYLRIYASATGGLRSAVVLFMPRGPEDLDLPVDLRLVRSLPETVRVRMPDGSPARGAKVELDEGQSVWIESGIDLLDEVTPGVFAIPPLPGGRYSLSVNCPGFPDREVPYEPRPDGPGEMVVDLIAACALDGTVVDDLGIPLEGAKVLVRVGDEEKGNATTDAAGHFRVESLVVEEHSVDVSVDGVQVAAASVAPSAATTRLVAPRLAWVDFRLVPPAGSDPPNAVGITGDLLDTSTKGGNWMEEGYECRVASSAKHLIVRAEGFVPIDLRLAVVPGGILDMGDIILDPGSSLRGTVLAPDSQAVPGADVVLDEGQWKAQATTGADGTFLLEHLSPGPGRISVELEGFLDPSQPVVVGRDTAAVEVRLARGGILRVDQVFPPLSERYYPFLARAVALAPEPDAPADATASLLPGPAGNGLAGAVEEWTPGIPMSDSISLGMDPDGITHWAQGCRVPPGRYRVEVVHEGKVVFSRVVSVAEGGTETVDFPVPGR